MAENLAADADELPSMLWGLDPVFSAYSRLYITDILQMRESRQVPGVYFYKTHPLFQVDVLGTVVYKREREDFYCYGVDDGTGVINCLCWKDEKWRDQGEPTRLDVVGRGPSTSAGGFNIEDELRRLKEAQRKSSMLEIGDLLRVRGTVKTSRDQREIKATSFYKVNDPVMAVQISHMLEMPQLYKKCYDQPFQMPSDEVGGSEAGGSSHFQYLLSRSVLTLKEFLAEKEVARFRPYDVEFLLHPLIQGTSAEQESDAPGTSFSTQIRKLLKETLSILQGEGQIFRKMRTQDEVYNVTEQDKDLLSVIRDILREDTKRDKYAEKGCHILHILSSVRQRYSQNLNREALEVALTFLECNSDIISTTEAHYTVL
ncbi:CST complex subunit STN1-like isoform X1 [Myxocyprinus asiaticus]|uniref:CST complex subunit STN1-like isoform X1 n=1 Tax=Myxocyprinus asiaticus TaxID=70543 RepID=UPI002223A5A6|nr:CST complex subunit STN1-like isoform X1 [Myxocyprinus asiaticus]